MRLPLMSSLLHGLGGDDDGAVALAETGAAVQQDVFVADGGVGGEADGGDVVGFAEGRFVQSLNVGQDVGVLVTGRGQLVGGQRVKHESVVGVGRVSELDFDGLFAGFECRGACRHGGGASFFFGAATDRDAFPQESRREPKGRTSATQERAWRSAGSFTMRKLG